MSNEWFERGELPPVGARFEAYFERDNKPKWSAGVVAYKSYEHVILIFDDGDENYYKCKQLTSIGKFRPAPTKREMFIDYAVKVVGVYDGRFGLLFDAGFRLPEDKE